MPVRFDLTKSLELPNAVIDMDHIVAGLQFGKIAEETGSANFAAGPLDRGRDVEKIGVTEKSKLGIGKRDAFREGGADKQHRGGFVRGLGGEAGGGIFRFAENVGDFVFAADVRKALDLSGARGGQENRSAGSELGFHVSHAGNDIPVKTRAGPRGKFKLRRGTDPQRELFDMNLRSFFERGRKFLFGPEVVRRGGRISPSVTLVIFSGSREMLGRGLTQSLRLIEE